MGFQEQLPDNGTCYIIRQLLLEPHFAMHSETVLCLFGLYCEESGLALKQAA